MLKCTRYDDLKRCDVATY